jgi:hypothetical protein
MNMKIPAESESDTHFGLEGDRSATSYPCGSTSHSEGWHSASWLFRYSLQSAFMGVSSIHAVPAAHAASVINRLVMKAALVALRSGPVPR